MMIKAYEFELHIYQKLDFYSCNTCAIILKPKRIKTELIQVLWHTCLNSYFNISTRPLCFSP